MPADFRAQLQIGNKLPAAAVIIKGAKNSSAGANSHA
jgi:hypothetical protein